MRWKLVTSVVVVLLLGATLAFAQGTQTGILCGTVTTADKLSVPGTTVTIKSPALQGERTAVTETDGGYLFRLLPPGTYAVTYTMSGMGTITKTANVQLGQTAVVDVVMSLAQVKETINVTAELPTVLTTPSVGVNLKHEEVEALAQRRDLEGIANLSPAVTEGTTPNAGQLNINGAFAYDNLFMVNGVDVNDNLFGSPQNVFIEDAIQETQVLTSGVSAEYGRFSGGVINAITKSGGNSFAGSFRMNLSNPTWSTMTPYEITKNIKRSDVLGKTYEATFGGPILLNRLWFFTAGRYASTTTTNTFPATGLGWDQVNTNKRGEMKFTGSVNQNHTIQFSYITSPTQTDNMRPIGGYEIDPHTLINRQTPNNTMSANYRGVLGSNLFAEVAYSQRHFQFVNAGGSSKALVDSPIWSLTYPYIYNAPYFDANDPEDRNNRQVTANLSYSIQKAGRHDLKGGWEWYRSTRTGGNSQSATGYVFDADYVTNAAGLPVFDSNGYIIPTWVPGESYIEHWMPTIGATLNTDTNSFFFQDHWVASKQVSFDVGLRYEKVRSTSTGGIIGVDTDTIVPRLALAFDPKGDGKVVFHATYAHYSGRYNDTQVGANSAVGNPAVVDALYTGPAGQGRNFAPGMDPKNYTDVFAGSFPLANISMAPGLSAPLTKEFTVSGGTQLGHKGSMQLTYVWRKMSNFIEDYIDIANGTTDVVQNGVDFGTFTNIVYKNSDVPKRDYQGMVFQADYRLTRNWQVAGNYTYQLKNSGNFAGEASNQPGIGSAYGNYPVSIAGLSGDYPTANGGTELPTVYTRGWPDGNLYDYQQSKLRIWSIYQINLKRAGRLSVSGLLRADSALDYSLAATNVAVTGIQKTALTAAGYPVSDQPATQTVYFGDRGAQFFKGYRLVDASINYEIPVFKAVRPWLKFDVYNLFNNLTPISYNTTIQVDKKSPTDAAGIWTGYIQPATFGTVTSTSMYPTAYQGSGAGGRTLRVAFGLRW